MSTAHEPPAGPTEKRVSVLVGDRLCTGCGYNLVGQYVVRESQYALLIVRCPECGTAASVQEYPLLGRWANRIGVVLAALWFVFLLGAWPASSGVLTGFSLMTGEEAADGYVVVLRERHQADMAEARRALRRAAPDTVGGDDPDTGAEAATDESADDGTGDAAVAVVPSPVPVSPAPGTVIVRQGPGGQPIGLNVPGAGQAALAPIAIDDFDVWWQQQDPPALLAEAGGWWTVAAWRSLFLWIPTAIAAFTIGCFWSVVLIEFRRRWVLLWGAMVVLLAALFVSISILDWMEPNPGWYYRAARGQISPPAALGTLAWAALALGIGVLLGRMIARLLVRALLPPGLRSALAILWTAEGRPLPRGRSMPAARNRS